MAGIGKPGPDMVFETVIIVKLKGTAKAKFKDLSNFGMSETMREMIDYYNCTEIFRIRLSDRMLAKQIKPILGKE